MCKAIRPRFFLEPREALPSWRPQKTDCQFLNILRNESNNPPLGAARPEKTKKRDDSSVEDQLLLLEHEPVYTIGRTPDRSSLSAPGRIRRGELDAGHLPHPVFAINRGGQATYHGPGQLMGYPIIDLRGCGQDLHKYLRWLEQLLIDLLAEFEVASSRRESLTGVWVGDRKIASIGVGVRHWITMHERLRRRKRSCGRRPKLR